ncbi:MAG TPA: ABC transporter ATP-binding protein [Caulobacteraceae bacterium]|jgi:subfamily B ATP-binding cassette protein MsbA|nr:ABC transporter ATP-binding protein [Caulobacteraceae bacterium]
MTAKADPPDTLSARALARRIWRDYLARRWPTFSLGIFSAVVVAATNGALVWLLDPAVRHIQKGEDLRLILAVPIALIVLGLVRGAAAIGQAVSVNRTGHGFVGDMQMSLFSNFIRSDMTRLRNAHTGEYVASVLYDSGLVREAATTAVVTFTQNSLTLIAMIVVMFMKDWILAIIVLLGAPAASLIMERYVRRTRKAAKGAMSETSALSTAIMESLDGARIVKIEGREAYEETRVGGVIERRQDHIIKGANAKGSSAPAVDTVTMIITAAVIGYAGWRAQTGHMTVGALFSFMGSLAVAGQALRMLANVRTIFSEGTTAARRMFASLDVKPTITDPTSPTALPPGPCDVRVDNVVFAYHEGAQALTGVTLEANAGESIALVGPSGGGKSTVLNLIPRFYDPDGGRITLNNVDIRDVAMADLRAKIALVTQEPFLFDDTIRANIAYARPNATEAEIIAAAEAAAAHEFISLLPNGYDTGVGEAGARLSGGQRQRIAIARAFLKDAPILLLDEATSALDTESEAKVQVALERLMKGRTTLLIAHRLSTVRGADRIYVIDQGRVVEQGTHAALLAKGGLYARLAGSQDLETVAS